ncbi:MAG: bifunctional hydroxymethylpyrimidine kinase/phosphomethylpyrimidine kinase [Candidatus Thermoplasmatota archaeon]
MKKKALSIAGSDPSGGAGIQADLKTFNMIGVHGSAIPTCITIQNTAIVKKIHPLPANIISEQIDLLLEDTHFDAVKTGMLYNSRIARIVAEKIKEYGLKTIVDPVLYSTSGNRLSTKDLLDTLKKEIIPKAYILAPNLPETSLLLGKPVSTLEEMKDACLSLHKLGAEHVIIKGGHLIGDDASDVYYDGVEVKVYSLPRIPSKITHGSGCTYTALLAGLTALGIEPYNAFEKAKRITWGMINQSYSIGKGGLILDHSIQPSSIPPYLPTMDHFMVWCELKNAVDKLLSILPSRLIPEVGINIGYALVGACTPDEVCSIQGRINKTMKGIVYPGVLDFGVSHHIASVILSAMSYDMCIRSAMNIRYSKEILDSCIKAGLNTSSFNRQEQTGEEISTMEWGTKQAICKAGFIPDIIYDEGGIGKEPMIRILGRTPSDIVMKIGLIIKNLED